jgi:hypothetical protein
MSDLEIEIAAGFRDALVAADTSEEVVSELEAELQNPKGPNADRLAKIFRESVGDEPA